MAALALAAIIGVSIVVALAVIRSHGNSSAGIATSSAQPTCSSSGCAVVRQTLAVPRTTILYGASCSGAHGSWFLNVVEGGGNDQLRPSYAMRWSFAPGSQMAKPNGVITIPATSTTQVTLTLSNGTLSLNGTRTPNVRVAATGTLVVQLSGSTTEPTLIFTETGLLKDENALGLVSPFDVGGSPLTVPITTVKTMSGC